jgi:putative copper resistance protein D
VLTTLIAATRAVHFAAAIVLFGQFVYVAAVAPERRAPLPSPRLAGLAVVLLLASALAWLALEALAMSGLPPAQALSVDTLGIVATQTLFGEVLIARIVVASVLALVLLYGRARIAAATLAALVLATIALSGHAIGEKGVDRVVHVCADALHLLAAGAWLGALVPLIAMLGRASEATSPLAAQATRRFSTLGLACMGALLLSGIINACYIVSEPAALLHSLYGRMLLAKVAIFVGIVALAAVNRVVLMPRLAWRRLRELALAECLLGFTVIAIVGKLGITIPGPHHP